MGHLTGNREGMLADRFTVPFADHMLVPLPENVEPSAVASASDNLPDAYRAASEGLRHAPNGDVLIVGGRAASIGLYTIGFARALGASSVTYLDRDASRLATSEIVGARALEWTDGQTVSRHTVTIDASGTRAGLELALRSTQHEGICIIVAMPFGDAPLPLSDIYLDSLTFRIGRNSARAYIPAALDVIARGDMDPTPVTNQVVAWDDAEAALADPPDKLVILGPRANAV
jgi:threonine dehydrogenase-like Zn-dependent dehydrogenase